MSSKTFPLSDIGKFYKQLDDFKEKLVIILSQFDKTHAIIDINKYYDKLLMVKKANVRKPIELFYEYGVTKYAENILTRDEKVFLSDVSAISDSGEVSQHDMLFISQISQIWKDLQPAIKNNIWNYIQVICMLSERVTGKSFLSDISKDLKSRGKLE